MQSNHLYTCKKFHYDNILSPQCHYMASTYVGLLWLDIHNLILVITKGLFPSNLSYQTSSTNYNFTQIRSILQIVTWFSKSIYLYIILWNQISLNPWLYQEWKEIPFKLDTITWRIRNLASYCNDSSHSTTKKHFNSSIIHSLHSYWSLGFPNFRLTVFHNVLYTFTLIPSVKCIFLFYPL